MNLRKTRKGGKKKKKRIKKTAKGKKSVPIFKTGSQTPQQALQSSVRDAIQKRKFAPFFRKFLKTEGRTSIEGENQEDITIGITRFDKRGRAIFIKSRTKKRKQKLDFKKIINKPKINLDDLKRGDKFYAVEDIVGEEPIPTYSAAQDPDASYFHQEAKEELKDYELDSNYKPRKILYCEFIEISEPEPIFKYNLLNQYPPLTEKNLRINDNNMHNWDFYK